jgi:DMSO reductase anchor subunit
MNPAFSVIFLTTLIGTGQGLFIAVVFGQPYSGSGISNYGLVATILAFAFLAAGLLASFFHLGRPERAWRAVTKWRTSWLSREVIVLPIAMILVLIYAALQWIPGLVDGKIMNTIGLVGVFVMLVLFFCTAMIYACVKFLQEWATPWTIINYTVLGTASGFVLATALSAILDVERLGDFRSLAIAFTVIGLITRLFSFHRNNRIKYRSSVQTAVGIKHRKITQRSMGHTGGSFNTRAFFHHCSDTLISNLRLTVIIIVFVIPVAMLVLYGLFPREEILWAAFVVQFIGLLAERWLFFAQANHPQNLYYQTVS